MALLPAYASSAVHRQLLGITDVADIITAFRDMVLNEQTPVWTEPSAGLFKSPPDADGRFMDILLVANSATNLGFRVRNSSGQVIIDRSIDVDAAGNGVILMNGQFHAVIESQRPTPEIAMAFMIDISPESQLSHGNWVVGNGYRNAAGAVDGAFANCNQFTALDAGSPATQQRVWTEGSATFGATPRETPTGAVVTKPIDLVASMSGVVVVIGRCYQMQIVAASLGPGAELPLPIGDAQSAIFKVLGSPAQLAVLIACRKGTAV